MAIQNTIDAADAVVALINAAGLTEGITFARSFIPEFDPDEMPAPKGIVFPAALELERASRADDAEDSIIEVGIGRKINNETTDVVLQLKTVEEVKDVLRDSANNELSGPTDPADVVYFRALSVTLFVPELLRKRVALSIVRVTYRGFS